MLLDYKPGVTGHHDTRAYTTLALNLPLLAIAWTMVLLRIVVKVKVKKIMIEDVLIVISLVFTTALVMMTAGCITIGFGQHIWDIQPHWWAGYAKFTYAVMCLGSMPFLFTKSSMLFFYLRLAPHPTFRTICYLCLLYILLASVAVTLTNIFGCTPIEGGWNRDPSFHSKCVDAMVFYYFPMSNNAVTDILLMVLPIPILMRLQLGWKTKLGLVLMFTTGFLITAVSAFSLHALYIALHSSDVTWDGAVAWMWAMAEMSVGIITTCMPSMMLVSQYLRGDVGKTKESDTPGDSNGQNVTIGGGGGAGKRKMHDHDLGMISLDDSESAEYGMTDLGGNVKSTEVLVEPGMAK